MAEFGASFAPLLSNVGLWVGLAITLFTFSLILGDNALARLAQHVVVGATLGYATLMAAHYVVNLRVITPIAQGRWQPLILPLALTALLVVAGLERVFTQGGRRTQGGRPRKVLQVAAVVPLAILLGVGLATGVSGVVQGTLLAQARAAMVGAALLDGGGTPLWFGILTLLLTTATLLTLTLDRRVHVDPLPRPVRAVMTAWLWVGERALWIASGVLLARLFAARFTLLVERLEAIATAYNASGLPVWIQSLFATLQG